jgi:hypothetical protein
MLWIYLGPRAQPDAVATWGCAERIGAVERFMVVVSFYACLDEANRAIK